MIAIGIKCVVANVRGSAAISFLKSRLLRRKKPLLAVTAEKRIFDMIIFLR